MNAEFSTYEELEKEIEKYQKDKFVQFFKRDSRTIENAKRRAPNREFYGVPFVSKLLRKWTLDFT